MSTRLNIDNRNAIIKDALTHRFNDEIKELVDMRAAFASAVYDDICKKADRQKMAELPEGWVPETDNIAVQFGSDFTRIYFDGHLYGDLARATTYKRTDKRRVLAKHSSGCAKAYDATHKLASENSRLKAKEQDLKNAYKEASRSMMTALNAVTTVKRLIETWPEIAPFASKHETGKPALPALPTGQLNKLLDLPVEGSSAA